MSHRAAPDPAPRSAAWRWRVLERLVAVAALAAVLVAVGAWIAMNRPDAAAEAAGATSSVVRALTFAGASDEQAANFRPPGHHQPLPDAPGRLTGRRGLSAGPTSGPPPEPG
jgi:hypothetical protein